MLKKVSISGGSPVTLCEADNPYGANWGTDDIIVFGQGARGLWQVPGAGGTKQPLVTGDSLAGVFGHGPQILPGGKVVLFTLTRTRNWNDAQIVVQDLETGERRVLVEGGTDARYLPTGQLVYVRDGTLLAVPFDLKRLAVAGGPVPIVEGIAQSPGQTGAAHFSLSSSGSLVYVPGNTGPPNSTLVWVDRQGTIKPLEAPARQYRDPRLSPDGQRLALRIIGDSTDIWVYDITRLTLTRLTFEGINQHPVWTPDGSRVAFRSTRREQSNLFWKPADGSGQAERLTTGQQVQSPSSWSPDGQLLAFFERSPAEPAGDSGNYDIWVLPLAGDRKPRPFLQTPFGEGEAVFSPDGRWLAYVSNESGRQEIFVQPFPGPGGKWQISTGGGIEPVWARSGRELFYRNGDQMMTVDTTTQPSFRAGAPRLLFEGNFLTGTAFRANYDVTPDGQRFVMVQQGEGVSGVSQIHVVLNWFEELKRRVPAGR